MEIRNLITFVQVAELNSFTKAAKVLDYSQSTVSFQIKQLENELGWLLFDRINHTITLTEKGRELLAYAKQVRYLTDEFNQRRKTSYEVSGTLRIAVPDSVCEDMMLRNYTAFHERYPGINLVFATGDTEVMFRMLDHNEADLMMALDHPVHHRDYVIEREEPVTMRFVTGVDSPYATEEPLTLDEIASMPFILTEKNFGYRRALDEAMASRSLDIRPIVEIGRTDIIASMLESGIGVSYLPDFVTRRGAEEGRLVYLNVTDMESDIRKQLIYHKDKWVTSSMRVLLDYIKEKEFGRQPSP